MLTNALSPEVINKAKLIFTEADAVAIFAGAGMSVDSAGLPDFRSKERFWNAYPAAAKLNFSFADLATPSWFERSPNLAWAFYGHRMELLLANHPT